MSPAGTVACSGH